MDEDFNQDEADFWKTNQEEKAIKKRDEYGTRFDRIDEMPEL